MWIKENPSTLLVGMYIGVATMENSMEIPQKIKNRTTIQSCNSTFGYLSEKKKKTNWKIYICAMFITALFTIAKIWKQHEHH